MAKRIVWSGWEPSLVGGDALTSAGSASATRYIWDQLYAEGIKVVPAVDESPVLPPLDGVDGVVFYWRWHIPGERYIQRNNSVKRQWALIRWCHEHGVKFLIHDQDREINYDYMVDYIKERGGVITAPLLNPPEGVRRLMYPDPFPHTRSTVDYDYRNEELVYIGNNYDRYEQFTRLLAPAAKLLHVRMYGNWLEPSAVRQSKEQITQDAPFVKFYDRMPQAGVIDRLEQARYTMHLARPIYCDEGFVTIRWAEAVAAGCLAFIPGEFYPINELKSSYVYTPEELLERISYMKRSGFEEMVAAQRSWVECNMTIEPWLSMIKAL